MSNPGLNAIYNGAFGGINMTPTFALGKRPYHHHDHHHDHPRHGSGLMDLLKKAHLHIKDKKYISRGLTGLTGLAEKAGYGRRRRRVAGRRKRTVKVIVVSRPRSHAGRRRHRRPHY